MKFRGLDQNFYDLLEVAPTAAADEIHRAYQRAKQTYSSGSAALYSMFTQEEAKELLTMVEEAFRTLSNFNARREYDLQLARKGNKIDFPDFETPGVAGDSEKNNPAFKQRGKGAVPEQAKEIVNVPDGFKKTRYGVYEISEDMENNIKNPPKVDGDFLRNVRNYKKINLEQLATETRISKNYLAAIEADDDGGLPAPVFTRGFVAQVARILGLDEQKTASAYMKNLGEKTRA